MNSSTETQTGNKTSKPNNNTLMLPVGCDDFEKVRTEGFYYVDKTGLIEQMLDHPAKVTLFDRPRRFGKSLNMSMLKHFFEIGSDPSLFDGLAITQREDLCEKYMGKFPVISLSLKKVNGEDFETAYADLLGEIQREAKRLSYLQTSDALDITEKELIEQFKTKSASKNNIRHAIYTLSYFLEKHHGQKAIILIDEFDAPLKEAHINGYYDKMTDLILAMFGSALKGNTSLKFGVLTGCLSMPRASIYGGFNNYDVRGIPNLRYAECFGFSEAEVTEMFEYYGVENRIKDAKAWYGGYRFSNQDQEAYCPGDIVSFCDDLCTNLNFEPKPYWIGASDNNIIRKLINKSDFAFVNGDIEELINGGTIVKRLDTYIAYGEVDDNINNLWSALYMTGYLTTTKQPSNNAFVLRIPNYGIRKIYMDQVISTFQECVNAEAETNCEQLDKLFEAFVNGNTQDIERMLEERLFTTASYFDAHDNFYHDFLLALLNACKGWNITSNHESDTGKCGIIIESLDHSFGAAIEVKALPGREFRKLDDACAATMKQINDVQYTAPLEKLGVSSILKYGIAFAGKRCKVVVQK